MSLNSLFKETYIDKLDDLFWGWSLRAALKDSILLEEIGSIGLSFYDMIK